MEVSIMREEMGLVIHLTCHCEHFYGLISIAHCEYHNMLSTGLRIHMDSTCGIVHNNTQIAFSNEEDYFDLGYIDGSISVSWFPRNT